MSRYFNEVHPENIELTVEFVAVIDSAEKPLKSKESSCEHPANIDIIFVAPEVFISPKSTFFKLLQLKNRLLNEETPAKDVLFENLTYLRLVHPLNMLCIFIISSIFIVDRSIVSRDVHPSNIELNETSCKFDKSTSDISTLFSSVILLNISAKGED